MRVTTDDEPAAGHLSSTRSATVPVPPRVRSSRSRVNEPLLWCVAALYALAHAAAGTALAKPALGRRSRRRGGAERGDCERGDVPGWVLITLMTAGIVAALWIVAQEQLLALFSRAINSVSGHP